MDLSVKLGRLILKNPVTVASGTFGYAQEFEDLVDLKSLGAIITKTITPLARQGNATPRLAESASGMLNAIGLDNEGLDNFIKVKLPKLKKIGTKIIVSISAESTAEFVSCAKRLEQSGVEAIELNLSCPNIKYKNLGKGKPKQKVKMYAQDKPSTFKLARAVVRSVKLAVIAKLSPNVTDIVEIARAAEKAGVDAVSLVNTFPAMAIDVNSRRPKLANICGGLSGPAIKPIAIKMVYDVASNLKVPVIGMGGIISCTDALEFIIAGASAISVGTANFVDPGISIDIIKGIKEYCKNNKLKSIRQLKGRLIG